MSSMHCSVGASFPLLLSARLKNLLITSWLWSASMNAHCTCSTNLLLGSSCLHSYPYQRGDLYRWCQLNANFQGLDETDFLTVCVGGPNCKRTSTCRWVRHQVFWNCKWLQDVLDLTHFLLYRLWNKAKVVCYKWGLLVKAKRDVGKLCVGSKAAIVMNSLSSSSYSTGSMNMPPKYQTFSSQNWIENSSSRFCSDPCSTWQIMCPASGSLHISWLR